MGNYISRKLAPIALAFVLAGCHGPRDIPEDTVPEHGYKNFITTLASLCKTNKYILLGDTDHGNPVINEMTADPVVMQTIKDCGSTLVLEAGIEENKGYKKPLYPSEPNRTADSILTVQNFLREKLKLESLPVNLTGIWDKETNTTFSVFIAQRNYPGEALNDLMLSLASRDFIFQPATSKKIIRDFGTGPTVKAFLKALRYLDETAQLPVKTTKKTIYQDIQHSNGANWTGREHLDNPNLAANRNYARTLQASLNRLYSAAMKGVPVVYPDPRHEEVNYTELADTINDVIHQKPMRTNDDEINLMMTLDARANKDLKFRQAFNQLSKFMEYSLSESVNGQIAANIKALVGANPAVILYGSAHITEARDIDEMLGQQQTVTILLKARPDQVFTADPPGSKKKPAITYQDAPQYIYDIHQDRMTKLVAGEASENAYRSMVRYGITKQEYDRSIKAMPEDLRPYALPYSYYDSNPHNDGVPANWLETDVVYKNTPG